MRRDVDRVKIARESPMWTLALAALLLVGCATPALIVMKNPRTDQVVKCDVPVGRHWNPAPMIEACAQDLERDGWVRLTPKE